MMGGSGWARMRGGRDSLGYGGESGQSTGLVKGLCFGSMYGSKVVIMEEDIEVE